MKRRLHFFISGLGGGGAERVCSTLANEMARTGDTVSITVLGTRPTSYENGLCDSVRVENLNTHKTRKSFPAILRWLRRERPEVVLVFNHQAAVLILIGVRLLGLETRVIARNISTLSRKRKLERSFWHRHVVYLFIRVFYRHMDAIIAQSQGMANDLQTHFSIPAHNLYVIHNPVAHAFATGTENVPDIGLQPCRLLFVGRLDTPKDPVLLIRAFARFRTLDPDARLDIVGTGPLKDAVRHEITAQGLPEDAVVLHGFRKDVGAFYQRARLLLLTSHYEGFPNVLVEAMACGTPVVAVDCQSGPSEIIEDGVNGFLVKSRDPQAIANTMDAALQRPWNRNVMRKSVDRFSPDHIAQEYLRVIEMVVKNTPPETDHAIKSGH